MPQRRLSKGGSLPNPSKGASPGRVSSPTTPGATLATAESPKSITLISPPTNTSFRWRGVSLMTRTGLARWILIDWPSSTSRSGTWSEGSMMNSTNSSTKTWFFSRRNLWRATKTMMIRWGFCMSSWEVEPLLLRSSKMSSKDWRAVRESWKRRSISWSWRRKLMRPRKRKDRRRRSSISTKSMLTPRATNYQERTSKRKWLKNCIRSKQCWFRPRNKRKNMRLNYQNSKLWWKNFQGKTAIRSTSWVSSKILQDKKDSSCMSRKTWWNGFRTRKARLALLSITARVWKLCTKEKEIIFIMKTIKLE